MLADVPHQARVLVRVTGEDALRFLQGLLTADVGQLTVGTAVPSALLTVKGKIVSELWVLAVSEDEPWLALPADRADEVIAALDGHIIMDDVELERLDDHALAFQWVADSVDPPSSPAGPGVRAFAAEHPARGRLLAGPQAELAAALATSEAATVDTFTRLRVEQNRPAWGHELSPDRFPPEVGFVDAVSYDKGCYLGQEPLSRIHNRGKVNRVMVRVAAASPPDADEPVALVVEERNVGLWTTWVAGEGGAVVGLAVVRRVHAEPGRRLHAGEVEVEVTSGPVGDDPGIGAPRQG